MPGPAHAACRHNAATARTAASSPILGTMPGEIKVRLQTRARRNVILDKRDDIVRVSVAAAPVNGQANAALCKLVAKRAGVARGRVSVVRGERSRDKVAKGERLRPRSIG